MMPLLQALGFDGATGASLVLLGFSLLLLVIAMITAGRAAQASREARALVGQVKALHQDGERWFAAHREQVRALRAEIEHLLARSAAVPAAPPAPPAAPLPMTPAHSAAAQLADAVTVAPLRGPLRGHEAAEMRRPATAAPAFAPPAPPARPPAPAAEADDGEGTLVMASPGRGGRAAAAASSGLSARGAAHDDPEATILTGLTAAERPTEDIFHGLPELRVVRGPDQGQAFRLSFGRSTIGRANGNTAQISEPKSSRLHAEILLVDDRFQIRDNNSTNGTLHNGEPLRTAALEFGDVITIGSTEMTFTCEGYELRTADAGQAIAAFERMLHNRPDFVPALHNLAFLLERDVARRGEATDIWARLKKLER